MTIDEFVCDGIDQLMADAAAHATELTEASGPIVLVFMDAATTLRQAWHDWLVEKAREENDETT